MIKQLSNVSNHMKTPINFVSASNQVKQNLLSDEKVNNGIMFEDEIRSLQKMFWNKSDIKVEICYQRSVTNLCSHNIMILLIKAFSWNQGSRSQLISIHLHWFCPQIPTILT